jgi:alkyl sulfatase BDS1-like metallo-beta-lactamase superfamily hydrolase
LAWQVSDRIFVATGFDLANTILIKTSEGHVVVDVGISPSTARVMRSALEEKAGVAPIHSIIYTHSHMVS